MPPDDVIRGAYHPPPRTGSWGERISRLMWARHANPLSGWSRVVLGVALPIGLWSQNTWVIGLLCLMILSNPIWFAPPSRPGGLMYHIVRGERLWICDGLNRAKWVNGAAVAVIALLACWLIWLNNPLGILLYLFLLWRKLIFVRKMVGYSRARPGAVFP